ncbi:MAG: glycosyltransferase family 39 protein [Bryobacterales bacterium]|nr:glycosyltransferase family 39 protein [Bryobacterales bacterium]
MTAYPSPTRVAALVVAAILLLHLVPLERRGFVGPDEPRYASIAREMAESGDWVTPRLWGEPWFEKPPMLFWLGGLGHLAGADSLTRLPVALLCLAFLAFFHWRVRRSFGRETAIVAACLLATAAGWVACADAGIVDAPLTVFVSAALLCLLDWPKADGATSAAERAAFGGLLGMAALSKGLVGPMVAALAVLPTLVGQPRRLRELAGPLPLGAFCATCLPWYAACYLANGDGFVREFLVRHHFERFVSSSLQHVQPWWFYAPVLALFMLPWTPLLGSLRWHTIAGGPRRRFLACWALGPLVFFSLSVNKLPAYVLPVLPPLAVLLALRWKERPSRPLLAASAGVLLLLPLAGALLPDALADGVGRAWGRLDSGTLAGSAALGALFAALGAWSCARLPASIAAPATAATVALALGVLKHQAYPAISAQAGAREFVRAERGRLQDACIGDVRRHYSYGIRFYTRDQVPECQREPAELRVEGDPPRISRVQVPEGVGRPPAL